MHTVAAPPGTGKTSFSLAFIVATTRYAEQHPEAPYGCGVYAALSDHCTANRMLALLALFIGVLVLGFNDQPPKQAVTVTIPGKAGPPPTGNLTLECTWTQLSLKTAAGQQVILPQQNQPVTIVCQ